MIDITVIFKAPIDSTGNNTMQFVCESVDLCNPVYLYVMGDGIAHYIPWANILEVVER